jgi:hypothetical protein
VAVVGAVLLLGGCGLDAARADSAEAGDNAEERVARAKMSLEEVNEKWARVRALVADRCN